MLKTGLVWFRNDLRVADNYSLSKAVLENDRVIAVFFFDPRSFEVGDFGFRKTEKFRAKFLLETVAELKENLAALNISLLVYLRQPEEVMADLVNQYTVNSLYLQKEWTPEETGVVFNVKEKINNPAVKWVETFDQFLFHPDDIPLEIHDIPRVFTHFRKLCEKSVAIRPLASIAPLLPDNIAVNTTKVPTLIELGLQEFESDYRTVFPFKGGEGEALARIQYYFWETKKVSYYKKTRNGLLGVDYSSKLSTWLANGSLSPRTLYFELVKYEQEIEKNESTYWLVFELIWRDFFKYVSMKHGNDLFKIGGILQKDYDWSTDKKIIDQWVAGETKEPFVNANMLEILNTGWMSNRGRQNVASFFAKELTLDWRIGAAYFESLLLDYDVHSNYGNWSYVAGVGNDPRDRKFNIQIQSERYDPRQTYASLWLQPTLF
jgi:deoxyribodipyrimidine photo-lyase